MEVQFLSGVLYMKPKIILASQSIGRRMLLEKLKVDFEIKPSTVNEEAIIDPDPYKMLVLRARAKAEDIMKKLTADSQQLSEKNKPYPLNPNPYLIIAADSMAVLGNKTFGKARNSHHAKGIVRSLMGATHDFATATTLIHLKFFRHSGLSRIETKKRILDAPFGLTRMTELNRWENITHTTVTCRSMSEEEIELYTSHYDFSRFAAGYALNETPWDWVTKIEGSYTNVIGLPFEVILPIFKQLKLLR